MKKKKTRPTPLFFSLFLTLFCSYGQGTSSEFNYNFALLRFLSCTCFRVFGRNECVSHTIIIKLVQYISIYVLQTLLEHDAHIHFTHRTRKNRKGINSIHDSPASQVVFIVQHGTESFVVPSVALCSFAMQHCQTKTISVWSATCMLPDI